jgi:hypothetical protein
VALRVLPLWALNDSSLFVLAEDETFPPITLDLVSEVALRFGFVLSEELVEFNELELLLSGWVESEAGSVEGL